MLVVFSNAVPAEKGVFFPLTICHFVSIKPF